LAQHKLPPTAHRILILEVSQNAGTPKSFILIGLSIDHPAIEVPSIDGNLPKTALPRYGWSLGRSWRFLSGVVSGLVRQNLRWVWTMIVLGDCSSDHDFGGTEIWTVIFEGTELI